MKNNSMILTCLSVSLYATLMKDSRHTGSVFGHENG